ncbi:MULTISPECIES: hypothetical protein [Rhodococcus]|uniref:Uncharacterized protein n=1 Tax=Rhodococcus oxybenzonivorans TaxID=1990687 RepID=A0AAE5A578_9NOCA|nr:MULTISPECIES: hypothetical protein [Rhodococcus]MDV7242109.1 hypothetical protein [Rhodococcus oxybenzonivorans]MDV7264575.1 hypothetical protein [Rhodococcus oxybenzonivorans]MDV7276396.1 hypothetical protein [Rhodococcus oxybenzonivorans]MDV7331597.1 hypothetical protein [Rhodococcus oxybenzonivorans]MDV7343819.1 hypothetical protein [Rhodococcus oxybenzonivorans]
MSMGVGLRIGSVVSTAVVASNDPGSPDPVVIVRDTVLHMCPDGTAILGGSAPQTLGRTHTVSGFLPRVGDPAGVALADGTRYRAEDLVAGAMRCLLRECEPLPDHGGRTGGAPDIMASYPTRWDSTAVAALRDALDYADMSYLSLVSDAEAAAAWFESEIAERPGQLVGIYHVDDTGATVALIRSGVEAGKAFRFASGGTPSAQIATALGAFGWLPSNLDAVVVTGDGLIARDAAAIRGFATSVSEKFDVRCVVGPGPEQTAALGAAIRAAGFNPTTHRVTPIGLPPSYDVTEVIDAVVGEPLPAAAETPRGSAARTTEPTSAAAVGAAPARATGATAVATPPEPRAVAQDAPITGADTRSSWLVAAVVGLALVLVAIVFVLFVL